MTWQDIKTIVQIADDARLLQAAKDGMTEEEYYTAVLEEYERIKED